MMKHTVVLAVMAILAGSAWAAGTSCEDLAK
jgi:hypothetical protein